MEPVFLLNRIVTMALRVPALVGVLALPALPVLAADWHPEEPGPDTKDWVQLTSGEWVRGSIDLFRDLEMQFDSDDLDDLTIDWGDIHGPLGQHQPERPDCPGQNPPRGHLVAVQHRLQREFQ